MRFRLFPLACAVLACSGVSALHGAVLSEWNFNGTTTNPSGVAAGLTAESVGVGTFAGTVGPNGSVTGVGGTVPFVFPVRATGYVLTTTESEALSANHTLTFTVTPDAG